MTSAVIMCTLTCKQCGMDWERPVVRGAVPTRCPECRNHTPRVPRPRQAHKTSGSRLDTNGPGYRLALAVTSYRLAIEEASAAIRIGKYAEALAALDRVQAPARLEQRGKRNVVRLP